MRINKRASPIRNVATKTRVTRLHQDLVLLSAVDPSTSVCDLGGRTCTGLGADSGGDLPASIF